jgi:cyanate permease
MLYYFWRRIWSEWTVHGVRQFLLLLTKIPDLTTNDSWAHEICSEDNEERALVIGSMNEMAYVFQAWLPLIVWQQVDAPEYRKGFITVSCISLVLIITTFFIRSLDHKENTRRRYVTSTDYSFLDMISQGLTLLTSFIRAKDSQGQETVSF